MADLLAAPRFSSVLCCTISDTINVWERIKWFGQIKEQCLNMKRRYEKGEKNELMPLKMCDPLWEKQPYLRGE